MGSPVVKALLGSLLVFALPIVTPHMTLPFGAALVMGWIGGRPPLWMAAEAALAVFAHDIAFLLGWRYFRGPSSAKRFVYWAAFPVLWWVINWAYLVTIPQAFLVDSTEQPDMGEWPEECFLEGYYLPDVKTPADLSLERAGRALVAESTTQEMELLETPGCRLTPLGLRWSNADPSIRGASATGAVLYSQAGGEWRVLPGPGAEPVDMDVPDGVQYPDPVLSVDGAWVAWLARPPAIVLTPVAGGDARSIDLAPFAPGSFRLDFLDMQSGTVILARNETEFLTLGLDGAEKAPPWRPPNVEAWAGTVLRLDEGWAAWDAYEEDDPYRLEWDLPAGEGLHTVRRGFRISAAALDPGGRFLAASISGRYNFDMPDAVYVLSASSGETVFRRTFPRFTRSRVAFPGAGRFAYSAPDGVRILRLDE